MRGRAYLLCLPWWAVARGVGGANCSSAGKRGSPANAFKRPAGTLGIWGFDVTTHTCLSWPHTISSSIASLACRRPSLQRSTFHLDLVAVLIHLRMPPLQTYTSSHILLAVLQLPLVLSPGLVPTPASPHFIFNVGLVLPAPSPETV